MGVSGYRKKSEGKQQFNRQTLPEQCMFQGSSHLNQALDSFPSVPQQLPSQRLFTAADLDNSGDLTLTELRDLFQARGQRTKDRCHCCEQMKEGFSAMVQLELTLFSPKEFTSFRGI